MWITLWIDVDKSWISCDSHAIQLNFSCIILCPLGVSRPLCTHNPQNQHLSPSFVDKFADTVRFLLLCTRLCTMFDISVPAVALTAMPCAAACQRLFSLFAPSLYTKSAGNTRGRRKVLLLTFADRMWYNYFVGVFFCSFVFVPSGRWTYVFSST